MCALEKRSFLDFAYEKVSVEEARQSLEDGTSVHQRDWTKQRLPQTPEALLDATAAWLMELPDGVRPVELAKRFPRIANKLYELRLRPGQFEHYLTDLFIVRRGIGMRQGFPARVASEIAALNVFCATLHPPAPMKAAGHLKMIPVKSIVNAALG